LIEKEKVGLDLKIKIMVKVIKLLYKLFNNKLLLLTLKIDSEVKILSPERIKSDNILDVKKKSILKIHEAFKCNK